MLLFLPRQEGLATEGPRATAQARVAVGGKESNRRGPHDFYDFKNFYTKFGYKPYINM